MSNRRIDDITITDMNLTDFRISLSENEEMYTPKIHTILKVEQVLTNRLLLLFDDVDVSYESIDKLPQDINDYSDYFYEASKWAPKISCRISSSHPVAVDKNYKSSYVTNDIETEIKSMHTANTSAPASTFVHSNVIYRARFDITFADIYVTDILKPTNGRTIVAIGSISATIKSKLMILALASY